MRMYPRSEFPSERLPDIVSSNGSVSRVALKARFSAVGCPNAKPEVAAQLIKAGYSPRLAMQLTMLAYYAEELMIDCVKRTSDGIQRNAEQEHAEKFPRGRCAEDLAARREGRVSRWGTPEYHRQAIEE